ncbi:MAG: hypothetical protein AAF171_24915 [Cyanobacteria bacterium P01_A01_bin.116]
MASTPTSVLDTIKSKRVCTVCQENGRDGHKLSTHENLKMDEFIHYQCLSCGFEFFENEDEQKFSEKKAKKNKEVALPWTAFSIFFFLIVGSILIITNADRTEKSRDLVELNENTELLIQQQQQWVR